MGTWTETGGLILIHTCFLLRVSWTSRSFGKIVIDFLDQTASRPSCNQRTYPSKQGLDLGLSCSRLPKKARVSCGCLFKPNQTGVPTPKKITTFSTKKEPHPKTRGNHTPTNRNHAPKREGTTPSQEKNRVPNAQQKTEQKKARLRPFDPLGTGNKNHTQRGASRAPIASRVSPRWIRGRRLYFS